MIRVMVFTASFNRISVMSWRSVMSCGQLCRGGQLCRAVSFISGGNRSIR